MADFPRETGRERYFSVKKEEAEKLSWDNPCPPGYTFYPDRIPSNLTNTQVRYGLCQNPDAPLMQRTAINGNSFHFASHPTAPKPEEQRHLTDQDRQIFRENAMMGTEKWENESTELRKIQRSELRHTWGFDGKSPDTKPRAYKENGNEMVPEASEGLRKMNASLLESLRKRGSRHPFDPNLFLPPDHPYTRALISNYEFKQEADQGNKVKWERFYRETEKRRSNIEREREKLRPTGKIFRVTYYGKDSLGRNINVSVDVRAPDKIQASQDGKQIAIRDYHLADAKFLRVTKNEDITEQGSKYARSLR